jgi:hypothetical protein
LDSQPYEPTEEEIRQQKLEENLKWKDMTTADKKLVLQKYNYVDYFAPGVYIDA